MFATQTSSDEMRHLCDDCGKHHLTTQFNAKHARRNSHPGCQENTTRTFVRETVQRTYVFAQCNQNFTRQDILQDHINGTQNSHYVQTFSAQVTNGEAAYPIIVMYIVVFLAPLAECHYSLGHGRLSVVRKLPRHLYFVPKQFWCCNDNPNKFYLMCFKLWK